MIDFLKYRWLAVVWSTALIFGLLGVGYIYKVRTQGAAFTYSIDFTGGTQVLLGFDKATSALDVRKAVEAAGWANPMMREFSDTEVLVRVKEFSSDTSGIGSRIQKAVADAFPDRQVTVKKSEGVGAGIGSELRWNAIKAVLISLLALLVYIGFSFWSFAFAVGATLALAHDAFIMLASLLLFDREVSIVVIGAILAVLGYSINDTIVIFAQIRNHLKSMKGASLYDIVNVSINQTLRRTLLTSGATALTVLSMLILGGEALRDFSWTLLIGIVFGTYSSIYVASPIMMWLYKENTH